MHISLLIQVPDKAEVAFSLFNDKELKAHRRAHSSEFSDDDKKNPSAPSKFRSPNDKRVSFGSIGSLEADTDDNDDDDSCSDDKDSEK